MLKRNYQSKEEELEFQVKNLGHQKNIILLIYKHLIYMTKIISFLKFIFQALILSLIILSLFPGSLLGLLLYQDLGRQPNLIENPLGININHFISYFYVSTLGLFLYSKSENFQN